MARLSPGPAGGPPSGGPPAGGLPAPGSSGRQRSSGAGGAPLGSLAVLQLASRSLRAGAHFGEVWTHQSVFLLTLEIRERSRLHLQIGATAELRGGKLERLMLR